MVHRPENRKNPRVRCAAPATYEGPRGVVRGQCRDVSQGGFFFLGPPQPVGRSFDFKIDLNGIVVSCNAEVRYHHTYPDGVGMGVKFSRISGEDLQRVISFLSHA